MCDKSGADQYYCSPRNFIIFISNYDIIKTNTTNFSAIFFFFIINLMSFEHILVSRQAIKSPNNRVPGTTRLLT